MNCYKCQKEMVLQREDVTNNFKKGKRYKEYKRMVYWCKKDDIWITFEIPIVTHTIASTAPDDLLVRLRAQIGLITLWNKLNPSTKKKYIKFVESAKREVTRYRRIERVIKIIVA